MTIKDSFFKITSNKLVIPIFLFIVTLIFTVQNISLGVNNFWGGNHTHYNNYVIFKFSFLHLIENSNLYDYYPNQYADLYKYSPTFAFFMGLFSWLPDSLGLLLWNSINVFVLYYALISIATIDLKHKMLLVLFVFLELNVSTQNSQSNALIAGLTIITFNMFEKGKNTYATLFIALGFFIKIYSIIGCLLLFLYPNKIKSIITLTGWCIILLLLPLVSVDYSSLILQYENWYELLKMDQNESIGMSIYLYTNKLIPNNLYKLITLFIGLISLILPIFLQKKHTNIIFRTFYLALILIWMVVFNYKAESPTFIIAMSGVGIWYFNSNKTLVKRCLIILSLIFTSVWFTDIIPYAFKDFLIDSKFIKPIFSIIILGVIFFDLMSSKYLSFTKYREKIAESNN